MAEKQSKDVLNDTGQATLVPDDQDAHGGINEEAPEFDEVAIEEEREKQRREREARAQALTLEIVGDLPYAEVKPPENVLFVCKLNPVTEGSAPALCQQIFLLTILSQTKISTPFLVASVTYYLARLSETREQATAYNMPSLNMSIRRIANKPIQRCLGS